MIGFHARQDPVVGEEFTPALDGDESGSLAVLEDTVSVRRLTPLECSRLQGFPDWWLSEVCNADANEANAREVVRRVRSDVGEETFETWGLGVLAAIRSSEVLWCALHGGELRQEARRGDGLDDGSLPRAPRSTTRSVREMRQAKCPRCASQEWELAGQLADEFDAIVSQLPSQGASGRKALCALRWAAQGTRLLQSALHPVAGRETERCPNALSDSARYAQLGNAVAVPVVEWIARRLVAVDAALGVELAG